MLKKICKSKSFISLVLLAVCIPLFLVIINFYYNYNKKNDKFLFFDSLLPSNSKLIKEKSIYSKYGEILKYTVNHSRGISKVWKFPDESIFLIERSNASFLLNINASDISNYFYSNDKDKRTPIIFSGNDYSIILQPALAREDEILDGTNYIADDDKNGLVEYKNNHIQMTFNGDVADWWIYITPHNIENSYGFDWIYDCTLNKFGIENRMTLDGYYYKTPTAYIPTGANHYYLNPAAYIASKLANYENNIHSLWISTAMLDVQQQNYNNEGYIPTHPMSMWLNEDYGIGYGFFDTRFNTDVALAILSLKQRLNTNYFDNSINNYTSFFINHVKNNYFKVKEGILVEDYSHTDDYKPTHVSLNHQLTEILYMYRVNKPETISLAKKMLLGIEETADEWIKSDNNLYYAYHRNNDFGGIDYPYLTYNDLFNLNEFLGKNKTLEKLMDAKLKWMIKNNINEYKKIKNK